jgi:hypothetical protein
MAKRQSPLYPPGLDTPRAPAAPAPGAAEAPPDLQEYRLNRAASGGLTKMQQQYQAKYGAGWQDRYNADDRAERANLNGQASTFLRQKAGSVPPGLETPADLTQRASAIDARTASMAATPAYRAPTLDRFAPTGAARSLPRGLEAMAGDIQGAKIASTSVSGYQQRQSAQQLAQAQATAAVQGNPVDRAKAGAYDATAERNRAQAALYGRTDPNARFDPANPLTVARAASATADATRKQAQAELYGRTDPNAGAQSRVQAAQVAADGKAKAAGNAAPPKTDRNSPQRVAIDNTERDIRTAEQQLLDLTKASAAPLANTDTLTHQVNLINARLQGLRDRRFKLMQEYQRGGQQPMQGQAPPQVAQQQPAAQGQPMQVASAEDAMKLPSGTKFVFEGKTYTRK